MPGGADFFAAGLLDGLRDAAREERIDLLTWLAADVGFTMDELAKATEDGTLLYLAARRQLGGGSDYTARELAERAGLELDAFLEISRASGLPTVPDVDAKEFGPGDLDAALAVGRFAGVGVPAEQLITTGRILGRGLGQTAEHMRQVNLELALQPGATELQLAQAYNAMAGQLLPLLGPMLEQLLRQHLRMAVRTEALSVSERQAGTLPGAREIGVAFADIVGFTRMGEELPPEALGAVADRLAELATDVAVGPVRLVKTIGDAVMFVSADLDPLLRACFDLLRLADEEGEEFPPLRVGIAQGMAASSAGDWFGSPVNVASRVTAIARANSVLVTPEVRAALEGAHGVEFSDAGRRRLKGVHGEVRVFRARPAG